MHLHQAPDTFAAPLGHVVHRVAAVQVSRVHSQERELADVRVGHDLEHQRREGLVVVGPALDGPVGIVHREAFDRRNFDRRRQVIDHRVQQVLHALVLEGRSADDREDGLHDGGAPQPLP